MSYKPKRTLGQNFLKDKNVARKIVATLKPNTNDTIIEIGPGPGVLTDILVETGAKIIAIDIDNRSIDELSKRFSDKHNIELINTDIRDYPLEKLTNSNIIKLIGNIPYNISSDIFFWVFEKAYLIENAVFTVQKEVAQRLCSVHGNKTYGITSVAMQLIGNAKLMFDISPHLFTPKPNVVSSVILMDNFITSPLPNYLNIIKLVKEAFNQRRKKMRNSISKYLEENNVDINDERLANYLDKRAEQLSPQDFKDLFYLIKKRLT